MNKKLIFGIGLVLVIGAVIYFKQGSPKMNEKNNPFSVNSEIKVGSDICAVFTKEWVATTINKTIVKTEAHNSTVTNTCQYYIDGKNFVILRLSNLSFENQKKGQQVLERKITTNEQISVNHFIAVQENNLINDIILEINPNLFLAVDRSSTKAADETGMINFAIAVSKRIKSEENQILVTIPTSEPTKKSDGNDVPLPLDTDIINSFFGQIELKRPNDAVNMMASTIINNESQKQAWAVQFNAIKSIKILSAEPSMKEDWTETKHTYKTSLDVEMDPKSADEPIPYFGWENGKNFRWITLIKEGKMWRIEGIATGP